MNLQSPNAIRLGSFLANCGLVLAVLLFAGQVNGQAPLAVKGRNFRAVPEYYPPPHEAQMKSLLEGAEAEQQPSGLVSVTSAKLQTFDENGIAQLIVETPQCYYDSQTHWVSGAGQLHARSADGRFSIDGTGFLWQQTNSSLAISNQVHTIVHPSSAALPPSPGSSPAQDANQTRPATASLTALPGQTFDIFSDRFDYAANSGQGIYSKNVRVVSTNLTLTAGQLTVVLPMHERRLEKLIARQSVIIDSQEVDATGEHTELHATGDQAVYSTDTGLIQLSDHPTWRTGQREGRGAQLILDPTNKIFRVEGQAWLKMSLPTNSSSGFLPALNPTATPPLTASNQTVEIKCDNYEIRTNLAVFRDSVLVTDFHGDQPRGHLNCAWMSASFSGSNQLEDLVAQTNVVIEQEDARFTSGKAVYTATNGLLTLTEAPAWQAGPRNGYGNVVVVDAQREEMTVRGRAFLRLPANQVGLEPASASASPKQAGSASTTNQFAEIFCESYHLGKQGSQFERQVRIEHPTMAWTCEQITVDSVSSNRTVSRMVAERDVAFDLIDEKGQKVHGTGDQALYTCSTTPVTNEMLQLTGSAFLQTTNGTIRNDVLIFHRANNRIVAPGKYRIYGQVTVNTNKIR